jgi:flavin reductase (DIM6/NTAB) family NADH-FMN oxidoreductase RutF
MVCESIMNIVFLLPGGIVEQALSNVSPEALRGAMRLWATGVTVVTTKLDGYFHGMTVSSFTSISLDPPLVMVSLEHSTRTHDMVAQTGFFGITILSEGQQAISERFAGRFSDSQDRFAGLETFTMETGAPFVAGGLAFMDSQITSRIEAGSHTLFIAQVVATRFITDHGNPIIYFNRSYRHLCS